MFEVKMSEGRQQITVFQHHRTAVAFHLPTWNEAKCLLVHRWSAYGLLARLAQWHDPHMLDMYLSCSPGKEHTTNIPTELSQKPFQKIGWQFVWHFQYGSIRFLYDQWSQFGPIGVNGNTWCVLPGWTVECWTQRQSQSETGRGSVWCRKLWFSDKEKSFSNIFFYPNQLHCLNNYLSLDRSVSN